MTDPVERAIPTGSNVTVSLQEHWKVVDGLRERFMEERDRRYAEVGLEREKALKIKEEADKAALGLAREIQTYKDEKANQLREQITSERGSFATKDDLAAAMRELGASIQPLHSYVASMAGEGKQSAAAKANIGLLVASIVAAVAVGGLIMTFLRSPPATLSYGERAPTVIQPGSPTVMQK